MQKARHCKELAKLVTKQSASTGRTMQRQMLDTGCSMLDNGYWILDVETGRKGRKT